MKSFNKLIFLSLFLGSCGSYSNSSIPPDIHERKDSFGRLVEKWGNEHVDDDNTNFHYFYYYNDKGLLASEKHYFLDDQDTACIIKDTTGYDYLIYEYKLDNGKYVKEKEFKYSCEYDSTGKFIGRPLDYIRDVVRDSIIYSAYLNNK